MRKSKSYKKKKENKKKLIINLSVMFFFVAFLLYSLWIPSSQIFGKTIHKNSENSILLTFDDGPGPETKQIADTLKDENISAIFFITCTHINESEKEWIKKISDEGHIIALHGYNHRIFQGHKKLSLCKNTLENITGKEVNLFRPPYGFKSPNTMFAAKKLNLSVMTWNVFPRDYSAENSQKIIDRVERNLKNNSIICLHDGPENRENTVSALPEILRIIDEKEYKQNN